MGAAALLPSPVAVAALSETIRAEPRRQVPSAREHHLGQGAIDRPPETVKHVPQAEAAAAPVQRRLSVRDYLNQLNPWAVAAGYGAFPIILFALLSAVQQLEGGTQVELFPYFRSVMGSNIALIGVAGVSGILITIFFGPYLGYLADRMPRVRFVRIGTLIEHGCFVLMGLAASPIAFIAPQSGRAIGSSINQVAQGPLVADYYPIEVRIRAGFFSFMVGQLAAVISFPLVGLLASGPGGGGP